MTIEHTARNAQTEAFEKIGGVSDSLQERTVALYDKIDGLSTAQKTLLVRESLVRVSGILDTVVHAKDPGVAAGMGGVGHAIAALGGYAITSLREEAGETSTGDTVIEGIFKEMRGILGQFATEAMSPEANDLSERIRARVLERVEEGEEFEDAMADELKVHAKEVAATMPDKPSQSKPSSNTGFYL